MAIRLERGSAYLQFGDSGHLVEVGHTGSGRTALSLPAARGHSPVVITCRSEADAHGGTTYAFPMLRLAATANGERCDLHAETVDGTVELHCRITPAEEQGWRWETTVANHGPQPVWAVTAPLLECVGWSGDDPGQIAVPFNSGWTVPVRSLVNQDELLIHYPVHAAMQWVDLWREDAGLYLAAHDPVPWLKQLLVRREATGVSLGWRYIDLNLRGGESVTLPPVLLAVHEGDWRAGADLYRTWISRHITFPSPPAWFAERPAWSWIPMKDQHAKRPHRGFADLPDLLERLKANGVHTGHMAGWMEHGHDTHFPDYWPGDCMGGAEGLKAAVAEIHRRGSRLCMYTNGRLADPEGSVGGMAEWQGMMVETRPCAWDNAYQRVGNFPRPMPWDPDQRLAKEQYTNVVFAIGCPGSGRWRSLLADRLVGAVTQCDADGLYIDQVCGCSALPCYAAGHDHARPPLAWSGYHALLGEVRTRLKEHNPDVYLATEGMGDLLGQYFDVQQAHNDWAPRMLIERGTPLPELFRWTFPEFLLAIGPTSPNDERYLRLGHAMAAGFDNFMLLENRCSAAFLDAARAVFDWRGRLAASLPDATPVRARTDHWPHCRVFALRQERTILATGAWSTDERRTVPDEMHLELDCAAPVASVDVDLGAGWHPTSWAKANDGAVRCTVPAAPYFAVRVLLAAPHPPAKASMATQANRNRL